ncbi:MAG: UDP-N-acetyl-D-glucosamine dehydrogenase [Gammaproteobacteria bacterium RIFCSPHIGHO2_12_FULL_35_23]|nr:MAG: UDP-N-acetyl-D-glucosamine dehydrogenase [Gammaproteobacteria bacterium RIFCSPHIGHO2_12_FULL_35_23]
MTIIRVAVIGVGYLGNFHAEKYSKIEGVQLAAVVDIDQTKAKEVANKFAVKAFTDYKDLVGQVDAVSIVVPTQLHFEVSQFFLEHGIHVLVEKPITTTVAEANTLIELAKVKQLVLQVGHLERFNATIIALAKHLFNPRFIESTRIAPFNLRGSDVNVMLDLMIHDIDIIQSIVQSPIQNIDANGACVLSNSEDIANARITFLNGCVANVTASRVSLKSERKMRIFQPNAYFSLDLQNKSLVMYQKGIGEMFPGIPNIKHETLNFDNDDALLAEIKAFIFSISNKINPVVSGEEGARSLQTAIEITEMVRAKAEAEAYGEVITK